MKLTQLFLLAFLIPSLSFATIYGTDDSTPIFRAPQLIKNLAPAVAIMASKVYYTLAGTNLVLDVHPQTDVAYVCSSEEPWKDYKGLYVSCTGFLIAPDLLLTAGHCAVNFGEATHERTGQCEGFDWVFDFHFNGAMQSLNSIPNATVVECAEVIKAVHNSSQDPKTGKITFADDYALIRLKKPILNRPYLKLSETILQKGDRVGLLGYPLGVPMMYSPGKVLSNENGYYRTNVDAFNGHSGSPVLDKNGDVAGILVRGYPESFWEGENQECNLINHCDEEATKCQLNDPMEKMGEHVQKFDRALLEQLLEN